MGTVIVLVIVLIIVIMIFRSMYRQKKAGKSIQCGCSCEHCGGQCHTNLNHFHSRKDSIEF